MNDGGAGFIYRWLNSREHYKVILYIFYIIQGDSMRTIMGKMQRNGIVVPAFNVPYLAHDETAGAGVTGHG